MNRHTLIVGGTGMLADASVKLATESDEITLVASTERSLQNVSARLLDRPTSVHLLALDWTEPSTFLSALREHVRNVGPPTLVVAWLHDETLGPKIAEVVCQAGHPSRFVQVLGSQNANPDAATSTLRFPRFEHTRFQRVILGFERSGAVARWLTHAEICSGVLSAIDSDLDPFVVGSIEPWSARP